MGLLEIRGSNGAGAATTAAPRGRPGGAAPRRIGRFELKRELGRGAQATVWLAHDPRLDREVALKLLPADADSQAVAAWLQEARAVSRLNHPNIVPVFEADTQQGQSYLVFEYVTGSTLAELIARRGALPPREAVLLLQGVVQALAAAHAAGIVHRDLKPSNILVDASGRARVMDFGIAARIGAAADAFVCGTPGYMSPEAARGGPPTPAIDVFAVGMTLAHMLAGAPLLRERDPLRAVERMQSERMELPAQLPHAVDDALRAIARRALSHDLGTRYADAAQLHEALEVWLKPADSDAAAAAGGNGTLEFLLRRMKHKSDFPALSASIGRIQRIAASENESHAALAGEILKDVALTNKLLRVVNTAHYSTGGPVSTVSRAVALVGFAGVRNMALSLVLLDHMQDKSHARQLQQQFLRSLLAGMLADEWSPGLRDGEEAFLATMFQSLGRMLVGFYLAEEAQQVRDLLAERSPGTRGAAAAEDAAARQVLGTSYEEIGIGVAKVWGLPETLQRSMRKPDGDPPGKAADAGVDRQRWLALAANEASELVWDLPDPGSAITQLGARYSRVLGVPAKDIAAGVARAQQRVVQMAQALQIDTSALQARGLRGAATPARGADTLAPHELQATDMAPFDATAVLPNAAGPIGAAAAEVVEAAQPLQPDGQVSELLAAGIQDITNHLAGDSIRLNEVLRMVLETMLRALTLRRVVFCLRDPKTDTLTGRFGIGSDAAAVAAAFRVPLRVPAGATPDLFTAVSLKAADTLIADASVPNIASRLPAWFASKVAAPSFLLLPLQMKNAPFGLLYADKPTAGGIVLGTKELNLLRTLRNQAVMAFRQAGG